MANDTQMELTRSHEHALETAVHQYGIDLVPIGRAYIDDLNHQDFRESGVYVLFRPLDVNPELGDYKERLEMLTRAYLPGATEEFLQLETDRRELSTQLTTSRMGLNEKEIADYEKRFPLGKSRGYDVFVKGGRGSIDVLALRETNTIHTAEMKDHDLVPFE
jgi:hypothetical protein